MIHPLELSVLTGPVPVVVALAAGAAVAALLRRRTPHWWVWVAGCGAVAVAVTAAGGFYVMHIWRPFPDKIPNHVLVDAGFGIAGCLVALVRLRSDTWRRRALSVVSAATLVIASSLAINCYYQQYRTVRGALGLPPANQIKLSELPPPVHRSDGAGAMRPVATEWRAPRSMPLHGRLVNVTIPGTRSGFAARSAWVYVPPAYLVTNRPKLPVLVLVAGLPGSPRDWITGGKADQVLDEYARQHGGLAPVVVIPDDLGGQLANPACLNSRLGQVETYLADDVPAWVRQHLEVDEDFRRWAIGGFSHGGTCALQLGVRRPDVFPIFLDISGQKEPGVGDRNHTIEVAFGGDAAAFEQSNPRSILARKRFDRSFAVIVSGSKDRKFGPQQRLVRQSCTSAGMTVQWLELPGEHNWTVWRPGFARGLPLVAARMGLAKA